MNEEEELRVRYMRGKNVVGRTLEIHLDDNPAYLTEFVDRKTAKEFYQKFQGELIPNFGNVKWRHREKLAVVVDEGYIVFDPNKKLNFHIWEYNSSRTAITSMGDPFVKLFYGIFKCLNALYLKDFHHGKLSKGITYSDNLDVKLYNFGKRVGKTGDGIRKDLKDLRKLVLKVINNNPHDPCFKKPDCVSFFESFNGLLETITHSNDDVKWKFESYFFFKNPIFANGTDRIVLIKKFVNLYKSFGSLVTSSITLDKPPAAMPQWWFRIIPHTYLQRTLDYSLHLHVEGVHDSKSIIHFCMACLRHKDGEAGGGMDEVVVEASLLETFPDLLPKLYYEFVEKLAWQPFPNVTWYESYMTYFRDADPQV